MRRIMQYMAIVILLCSLVPMSVFASNETPLVEAPLLNAPSVALSPEPIIAEPQPTPIVDDKANNEEARTTESVDSTPKYSTTSQAEQVSESAPFSATQAVSDPIKTQVAIPATDDLLITAIKYGPKNTIDTLELKNTATRAINVDSWTIRVSQLDNDSEDICNIPMKGYILPGYSVTFASEYTAEAGVYPISGCGNLVSATSVIVEVFHGPQLVERIHSMSEEGVYERQGTTPSRRTGVFTVDFKKVTSRVFLTSSLYEPRADIELRIVELHTNPQPCTPGDFRQQCFDYVKVYNPTATAINLGAYRLKVGQVTSTTVGIQIAGIVPARGYAIISHNQDGVRITLPNSAGTAWLQDEYGVVDYPSNVTPYEKGDTVANSGRSWAYDTSDGSWKWAVPSPDGDNTFAPIDPGMGSASAMSTLKPCREDQYRSEETNRCRSIATVSGLSPCKEGQYRSEETNRCRSLASVVSALKICADDQFRNPATNRCKKIASADDASLADCGEGRERNPATNRCRNAVLRSVPTAAFAVEPIKQGVTSFVGWWALGGVLLLAFGYAAWEWRQEVRAILRRAMATIMPGRK